MRHALITVVQALILGIPLALLLLSTPLALAQPPTPDSSANHVSPDSSSQRVFEHVSSAAQSVASLTLALITVLIALLALIGDRQKAPEFYEIFPFSRWLNLKRGFDRVAERILRKLSTWCCIIYVLCLSIGSAIACFFGHLLAGPDTAFETLHGWVELAMFIAVALFLYVLVRAFGYYLRWREEASSRAAWPSTEVVTMRQSAGLHPSRFSLWTTRTFYPSWMRAKLRRTKREAEGSSGV